MGQEALAPVASDSCFLHPLPLHRPPHTDLRRLSPPPHLVRRPGPVGGVRLTPPLALPLAHPLPGIPSALSPHSLSGQRRSADSSCPPLPRSPPTAPTLSAPDPQRPRCPLPPPAEPQHLTLVTKADDLAQEMEDVDFEEEEEEEEGNEEGWVLEPQEGVVGSMEGPDDSEVTFALHSGGRRSSRRDTGMGTANPTGW